MVASVLTCLLLLSLQDIPKAFSAEAAAKVVQCCSSFHTETAAVRGYGVGRWTHDSECLDLTVAPIIMGLPTEAGW